MQPLASAALTSFSGEGAGAQQKFPHCACKPAGLAVTYKGQVPHCRRQLQGSGQGTCGSTAGGDGCPLLLPSPETKKTKEPSRNPAQWGIRGQVYSPVDARRFPSAGMQNVLPWLLPMAVPASCLCSDAESSPMSLFMPCPTTPEGLKQLLYLLCLWEYLFLWMETGAFHLGHGNKGEQAHLGLHGPHLLLPTMGTRKPIGRCLLQLFGQGTSCSFSAAVLPKRQPLARTQPGSRGCRNKGCHRVGEEQIIGPGMEGGSCRQVLQHLAAPGKYSVCSLREP